MAAVFQLDVLAASVPFFQGRCVSAVIPVADGEYGVLAGHSNAVGAVCAGELRFETDIDVNRALRARREAEEELRQKRSAAEYQAALSDLSRALNRLRISGKM